MALTGKRKALAGALLRGKSNREAAVAAGYSEKTASAAGSPMAKGADVKEYVKARGINSLGDWRRQHKCGYMRGYNVGFYVTVEQQCQRSFDWETRRATADGYSRVQ